MPMPMPMPKERSIKGAAVSKGRSSIENAQKRQLADDCEGIKKRARQCQLDKKFGQGDLGAADAGPHEKQMSSWSELAPTDSASFLRCGGIEGVPGDLPWPSRSLLLVNLGSHVGMPHETFQARQALTSGGRGA